MTISKDLFLAILSMDSYNQGYGRGIEHGKTQIGAATAKSLINSGVNQEQYQAWQDVGFYAIAYDVKAGGFDGLTDDITVISYRGTDNKSFYPNAPDVWNGYGVSLGSRLGEQARLARKFYDAVKDTAEATPISVTGHSLGGGLAGLIASIEGINAELFDNMPFEQAAANVYLIAGRTDAELAVVVETTVLQAIGAGGGILSQALIDQLSAEMLTTEIAKRTYVLDTFFDSIAPSEVPDFPASGISAWHVPGEFLGDARAFTGQTTVVKSVGTTDTADNSIFELHFQPLLVIRMFSDQSRETSVWETTLHKEALAA